MNEIFNLFEYGFLSHINILIKLAKLYNVSVNYLLNMSKSKKSKDNILEAEYTVIKKLITINRAIAYENMLKSIKEQGKEKHNKKLFVAVDEYLKTGTDNHGK